eukprot:TRINITY_DN2562_c0_g1_i1.p2 TRINITY_DN2562_c0_g1~~TRINITY_DN2562_c0_g1_i1.p2  ORF type:complete len:233 (-),score=51.12 TRINITY_DN2562_c0_g1_i1:1294-1992(-)
MKTQYDEVIEGLAECVQKYRSSHNSPTQKTPSKAKYHYAPKPVQETVQSPILKEYLAELEAKLQQVQSENKALKKQLENEKMEKQKLIVELNQYILREKPNTISNLKPNENYNELHKENEQLKLDVESLKCIVKKRTEQANTVIKRLTQTNGELTSKIAELDRGGKKEPNSEEFLEMKANCIKLQIDYKIQGEALIEMTSENQRLRDENEAIMEQMKKLRATLFSSCYDKKV